MDIKHIEYLMCIVDNNYNLTKAANRLHISQPALSKSVNDLERVEDNNIFTRKRNRITGLTESGQELIASGRKIDHEFNLMINAFQTTSSERKGTINIGIPPVIISTLFNEAIPRFIQENPLIKLNIIETGAYDLQKMLMLQDIDIAVLVSPATYPDINEITIVKDSVSVWFNKNHRFHDISGVIPFTEIVKEKVVSLDDSFMVTYQWKQRLRKLQAEPNFFFQSGAWDLLLNMCQELDVVTLMASPIGKNFAGKNIEHRQITPFFPWNISLCTLDNVKHSQVLDYTQEWFNNFFKHSHEL
ncbi:LysR family transcriptional regulator [Paucilactobacillus oligofermentans DSM 15707 = LMG 22743]|uniref:LysR family transcriptional regulator n=1 Tax=Paucilactobacillus oligofermentans DSM 15707 = LMG 22743 TaxID=1423778 RepID=A0A0R1RWN1_9LACO|nr:LysR family transcriptional regulator [Paucilactobacillus oligofermentans]KRL57747.1 LysR family transcriptional regulator [Paucilactobacillus oligofermentans DSM 15707 = LMG 22743]CUS26801.1 HTH-type transcriptional regulator CynR [Paucilactobacillus oligofermentans DSM 15707 = LMG 22743]